MANETQAYTNPTFEQDEESKIPASEKYGNGVVDKNSHSLTDEERYQKRKAEHDAKAKANRDREPIFIVKFITAHPKKALALSICGHLFFAVLSIILLAAGYDLLPFEFTRFPLELRDDGDYLRGLSWDKRNEDENHILDRSSSGGNITQQSELLDTLTLLYFKEDGNVLTKNNLIAIQEAENKFLSSDRFRNEFCLLNAENNCSKPQSLIRFFDGTYAYASPIFNDPNFDNIIGVINEANRNPETKQPLQLLIAKTSVLEPDRVESWITASFISFGYPLEGYDYTVESLSLDRDDEQIQDAEEFVLDVVEPIGDDYFDDGVGDMDFAYGSGLYFNAWVQRQVFMDLGLAIGSICVIGLFICIQTGSLWITGFALFGIQMSFVEANIIYRVILDYRYIGIFHVLSVFIILGIGADDIFVFCDTWKETGQYHYKSLAHRLSDAYRRSALAMLFTSLTTAAAFIVSATSPFLVISAFGVFSGLLITVNYISVIVYLPCVVVIYHLYFEKYKCCCCCPSTSADITEERDHAVRDNFLVKFFSGPYYKFITNKIIRWFIMAFFGALLAVFIWLASTLEVQEEQIAFVSTDLNLGKYLDLQEGKHFLSSEDNVKIYLIFGLKEQDLDDCHMSDASCFGNTVYDENFDLSSTRVQQNFLDFCHTLETLPDEVVAELQIRRNPVTNIPEVECFAQFLQEFLEEEQDRVVNGVRRYPPGTTLTFPFDNDTVIQIMENNPHIYNSSVRLRPDWNNDLEVVTSFWINNGFQYNSDGKMIKLPEYNRYDPLIGEWEKAPTVIVTNYMGMRYLYGTEIKYLAVTINTTINDAKLGYKNGLPLRDRWEEVMSTEIAKLEPELQGGYQATPEGILPQMWHWLKVQEVLVFNAFLGIIIGIALAFPILVIATNNFVTGFLATFNLVCITVMVLGLIPPAGWKIGLLESLNMVLVVGLAVDYTVHLAEGYQRSDHEDRLGRTKDALTEVGISVTSGACTTVCSSVFLVFAKLIFFQEFGIFMVSTLAFSLIWAMGFFTTALAIIGPQGDFGNAANILKTIFCCKCRK